MSTRYRPEIDGLRTVAVLSVLIYHLKLTLPSGDYIFPGGFLGVDIFFVISGYLITGILARNLQATGRVGYLDFYARRARRILPPLLLVVLLCVPVAWTILLPTDFERFGGSVTAALLFYANLFWFRATSAYFDVSSLYQPLLHIWSLAVEEQFYVVFPIVLALAVRTRHVMLALWAMAALSFGLAIYTTAVRPELSFFATSSRGWQLLAGALLAMHHLKSPPRPRQSAGIVLVVALAAIVWPIVGWSIESFQHPGVWTAVPVLGVVAVLHFSGGPDFVTRALASRPMVGIGLISYSLYLWHYPVFAFGRWLVLDPGLADMAAWIALSFAGALFSFYVVERPFRFAMRWRVFVGVMASVAALLLAFGETVRRSDGYPARLSGLASLYGENSFDNFELSVISWDLLRGLGMFPAVGGLVGSNTPQIEQMEMFSDPELVNVLLVGNSHSKDLFNALYQNAPSFPGFEFARLAVDGDFSAQSRASLMATQGYLAADIVVIAPRYNSDFIDGLQALIGDSRDQGKGIIIANNTAEFEIVGQHPVFDWYIRQTGGDFVPADLNSAAVDYRDLARDELNARIAALAQSDGVAILDRSLLVCPQQDSCTLSTPDGRKTMYDYSHWTLEGAQYFGGEMARSGQFLGLLRDAADGQIAN